MAGKRSPFSTLNTLKPAGRAPADQAVFSEFARRLQAIMQDRGWNQSELARRCAALLPKPEKGQKQMNDFGRDLISGYVRGVRMPRPERLPILAKALGVDETDLVPPGGLPSANAAFNMRDAGGGRVSLKINRTMTMDTATKIIELLKKEDEIVKRKH